MTFYFTIIIAAIYLAYYQFLGGPTLDEELAQDMSKIQAARTEAEKVAGVKSEEHFMAMLDDHEVLAQGKAEFAAKCAACHGDKGQGIIGPNLTDGYWIHGDGKISTIVGIINEGVLDKGMPPWKGVIAPDLLEKVAVHVYSLRNTNPEGAKPPQGIKVGKK